MKVFAYADDVNYIVTTDEQSDHIFPEITTFINELHASIYISKFSFIRLNQCKMGPQLLREHGSLKILGIKLGKSDLENKKKKCKCVNDNHDSKFPVF
jgi:hypothetical protein